MTTRTIREADITIASVHGYARRGRDIRYRLTEKALGEFVGETTDRTVGYAMNYAEALQARADIIDDRAGAARVGDRVRVGLKGQATYIVGAIMPWGELRLTSESNDRTVRYFTPERLHVVEAKR